MAAKPDTGDEEQLTSLTASAQAKKKSRFFHRKTPEEWLELDCAAIWDKFAPMNQGTAETAKYPGRNKRYKGKSLKDAIESYVPEHQTYLDQNAATNVAVPDCFTSIKEKAVSFDGWLTDWVRARQHSTIDAAHYTGYGHRFNYEYPPQSQSQSHSYSHTQSQSAYIPYEYNSYSHSPADIGVNGMDDASLEVMVGVFMFIAMCFVVALVFCCGVTVGVSFKGMLKKQWKHVNVSDLEE